MHKPTLKKAEKWFLKKYPGGFQHPEMIAIGKKHKMDSHIEKVRENFAEKLFDNPAYIAAEFSKHVSRSSLVSMFEKPKCRDAIEQMKARDKAAISDAIYELLYGKEKIGFESLLAELSTRKLARWPLMTVLQSYYRPQKDVFVKPNTTKLIIEKLDLDVTYSPKPSWDFYRQYRQAIKTMKASVSKDLQPNNAAFCGFLMISLEAV